MEPCGKRPYRSVRAARLACARLDKRIRVYLCPICHGYHVAKEAHPS